MRAGGIAGDLDDVTAADALRPLAIDGKQELVRAATGTAPGPHQDA